MSELTFYPIITPFDTFEISFENIMEKEYLLFLEQMLRFPYYFRSIQNFFQCCLK